MSVDNELIRIINLIESGDKEACAELYEKTIHDVFKTVHFLMEEKTDIDDVIQDIYIQVFKSIKKFDVERKFKPWLMGIVLKQIKAYRRKKWKIFRTVKKVEEFKQEKEVDFSNKVIEKITNKQLVNLVDELPFKLKQVIILRYLNDYSQEEISAIMEVPIGTVKSRINAALTKLRTKGKNKRLLEEVRKVYEY
ncbi:sigma-70 family RNA polymerase sigma factor [Niallia circulans]|uniref:Sigma-70 family RNA polymerase sigma factor n=1 Tax=Niallia circulans TaxID=1397 RepID=A0A553STA1_NIACI|nr:sigma-70 family RNA polymerase sigma factor [Niallia circulans]TRZ40212.1 sigma-70 family RNA polymerase sigma factor [Niallia circulans]